MKQTKTKHWIVDNVVDEKNAQIVEIADKLKKGQVIAFPTETVYGLGANALDTAAIRKIFEAKGRPSDNPLIVHIAEEQQLDSIVDKVDERSQRLMEVFWPGPLTIIFERKEGISDLVTAGLSTIAVRMPDHPVALSILKAAGIPVAAPSANRSGKPSPTTAAHVTNDLEGKVDGIVDGGPTGIGVESTVIDVSGEVPTVLRPGGVTLEAIREVIGEVALDPALLEQHAKPRSPGMKYTHYAPTGEMWIIQGEDKKVVDKINNLAQEKGKQGAKVGILTVEEHKDLFVQAPIVLSYGTGQNLTPMAEHLYDALRIFDQEQVDFILAEGFEEKGIGLAIMNRLKKAAGGNILNL